MIYCVQVSQIICTFCLHPHWFIVTIIQGKTFFFNLVKMLFITRNCYIEYLELIIFVLWSYRDRSFLNIHNRCPLHDRYLTITCNR